jgi:hypothetical protein
MSDHSAFSFRVEQSEENDCSCRIARPVTYRDILEDLNIHHPFIFSVELTSGRLNIHHPFIFSVELTSGHLNTFHITHCICLEGIYYIYYILLTVHQYNFSK